MMLPMGHNRRRFSAAAVALFALLVGGALPAAAKSYSAERYDSVIRVRGDGVLEVTETVRFRFEEGTFREVFREIPSRRTDGIEVVAASMQGKRLPFGTEIGTVEVRPQSNRVRVIWRFSPVEGVSRELTLTYLVRGAVHQAATGDLLIWRALPADHQYRIDKASVRFELPRALSTAPVVDSRRTGPVAVDLTGTALRVAASDIRADGWIQSTLTFPGGTLVASPPAWQQRAAAVAEGAVAWVVGAAVVLIAGVILLLAWRQSYDAPPAEGSAGRIYAQSSPPDHLAPAVAGVVANNGRPALQQAMATLFTLAERGDVEIVELPRGAFGQRDFLVKRRGRSEGHSGYERAAMETVFTDKERQSDEVSLSRTRSRLTWKFRHFSAAMARDLMAAGLLDSSRRSIRRRYLHAGGWLLGLAGVALIPSALLTSSHGAWTLLIPAALAIVALASYIFAATMTPLSNDGARRSALWRGYRKHLTAVARGKEPAPAEAMSALLPLAVALGLADSWSKLLKRQGHAVPSWFRALQTGDGGSAFPAFIASGGAGASSGGAHGGAAGGGASGAH